MEDARKAGVAAHPSFDAVVFDLDGTLLDTLPDLVVLTNKALAEEGFPARTRDEIRSFVGNGVRALVDLAVPEGSSAKDAEKVMGHWKNLFPLYDNNLTAPYPGMPETLDALRARGLRLGVLSNKFNAGVQQIIGQFYPGVFSVLHGECAGIPRKPDPAGLLRTIDELGAVPERTLYVGDSPGDVRTARNAGTGIAGVTWGYHGADELRKAAPDAVVDTPLALLGLL